jgi:hypothetical protein
MQGTVYGTRMDDVAAYPGALEFIDWAGKGGIEVCIISHKTRHPFIGPRHDLHLAARRWVERHLRGVSAFFELTKEEKLERIRACGCDWYIDDLPEILLAPGFPPQAKRILFDPDGHHPGAAGVLRLGTWREIREHFQNEWK